MSFLFGNATDAQLVPSIQTIIKIGRVSYVLVISDDEDQKRLYIRVNGSTRFTCANTILTWPYQDKQSLLHDIDGFLACQPEPIRGEWMVRLFSKLGGQRFVGYLGIMAIVEEYHLKIEAYLGEYKGEKLLIIKHCRIGWKDGKDTSYTSLPFCILHEIKKSLTEQSP